MSIYSISLHDALPIFGFLGLLIEKLVDLGRAVLGIVGLRMAGIGAFENGIGIIDAHARSVEGDGVVFFRDRKRTVLNSSKSSSPLAASHFKKKKYIIH